MPPQIDPTRMNADPLANELGPQPTLDPQLLEDSSRELQNYLDAPFIPAFERFYVDEEGNYNMPEWKRQHWSALLKAHGWSGSSKDGFRYPEGQTPPGAKVHMSGVSSYLDRRDARRDKLNKIGTEPYSIQQGRAPGPHRSEIGQGGKFFGVGNVIESNRFFDDRERAQGHEDALADVVDEQPPVFEGEGDDKVQVDGYATVLYRGQPQKRHVKSRQYEYAFNEEHGWSLPKGGAPAVGEKGPAGQPGRSGPGAPSPLDAVTKPGDAGAEFPDFVPTEREFGAEGPNAFFFRGGEESPLLPERSGPGRPAPRPGMMYGNRQAPPGMQPDPNVAVPGYTPGIDSREYPPFDPNQPFGYEEPDSQWIDTVSGQAGRRAGRGQPPRTSDTPFFDQTRAARRADRRAGAVPPEEVAPHDYTEENLLLEEQIPEGIPPAIDQRIRVGEPDPFAQPEETGDPFADFDPALREEARATQSRIDAEERAAAIEDLIIRGEEQYLIDQGVLSRGEIARLKLELVAEGKMRGVSPRDAVEGGLAGATAPSAPDPSGQLKLLQRIKAKRAANRAARQQGRQ